MINKKKLYHIADWNKVNKNKKIMFIFSFTVLIVHVVLSAFTIHEFECFVPAKIMTSVIQSSVVQFGLDLGQVGTTFPHEEILRIGTYRSVARFFYDQVNGTRLIDLSKINTDYQNVDNIYYDYYNKTSCDLPIESLMKYQLQPNVAIVDFDPNTKDMPYAHFDAETFNQSNARVVSYTNSIIALISAKKYSDARSLTGQVLHTIQDFYSHSNWVEIGNTDINREIGQANFSSFPIITKNETDACLNNCSVTAMQCGKLVSILLSLFKFIGLGSSLTCPINYYQCAGNIVKLNELVSGYYSGQKLDDGTEVNKPQGSGVSKCSHGGILDKTSIIPATGQFNYFF